ncbi:MAG: PAS domain-containing protein [Halanaeroarchaeum sp.]
MDSDISVLFVDDDGPFVDAVSETLQTENPHVSVETVARAEAAMELIESADVDCVVSEYHLADRDGIDFLEAVRGDHSMLPFILYTADGSEALASEAIREGVTDYVRKERGREHYRLLSNRIVHAVESYRSQRELLERNRELRRYERMVDSMPEGACIYDTDGNFEVVNEFLADWYGTTRATLEGSPSTLLRRIEAEHEGDPFREIVDGERSEHRGEVTGEFPGHGYAALEYLLRPMTADGTIEGVVGVTREITERKERELELERQNALQSTLLDALPVGVLAEDDERDVMAINQQLFNIFEFSGAPAEFVGADCERLAEGVSESVVDSTGFVDRIDEVVAAREPVDAEEIDLADGRTLERTYRPIQLNEGSGHLWAYRDVTDRVEWERELREYKTIVESLPLGVFVLDEDGRILHGNPVGDRLLGYQPGKLRDVPFEHLLEEGVVDRDHVETYSEHVEALLSEETRGETTTFEFTTTIDGDPRVFELHLALRPSEAEFRGTIGIFQDVTEKKERQEALRRQKERFEEFAHVVSHDLRNPLNVASGRLELARADPAAEHFDAIEQSHERMETLIENLLSVARAGDTISNRTSVSLASAAEAAWQNVATGEASLSVAVDRTVEAEESRLQQLFENLFRNAVEYAGTDPTVTVGEFQGGFYVADDGPGIPADTRRRVFETGYTTAEDGTGFGLSIVERIVEAHDWAITATESATGGARFEITVR